MNMKPDQSKTSAGAAVRVQPVVRTPGDGQLWEWEIESHVKLQWRDDIHRYECEHMLALETGKYERFYMRLTKPHPELGTQVREGAMCCECYQMLRRLNLAPFRGTWEES